MAIAWLIICHSYLAVWNMNLRTNSEAEPFERSLWMWIALSEQCLKQKRSEAEEFHHFLNLADTCMCPLTQLHQILEEFKKLDWLKYSSTTLPFSRTAYRPRSVCTQGSSFLKSPLTLSISSEKTSCKTYFTNLGMLEDKD